MTSDPLYEINRTLGNLDAKITEIVSRLPDHDDRLDKVEKDVSLINQKIAWVSAAFGIVGTGLASIFWLAVDYFVKGHN